MRFSTQKKRNWLLPLAFLYGAGVDIKSFLLRKNIIRSVAFDLPIISVGNLSVGGTGKTPHVVETLRILKENYKCGIVSRGYGRKTKGIFVSDSEDTAMDIGDEPLMLKKHFPDVPVAVAEKRIWGIIHLLETHPETEVVILDDAMQHRRLRPGFNVMTTPYHNPFYENLLLPAGSLRERRTAADRAQVVVVTKCPKNLTEQERNRIKEKIKQYTAAPVVFTAIQHQRIEALFPEISKNISTDNTKKLLVAGIADPEPLIHSLSTGSSLPETMLFSDHHYFTESDLEKMHRWQLQHHGLIITTEKDAARFILHENYIKKTNLQIFVLQSAVLYCSKSDEETYRQLLNEYVAKQLAYYKS